jgi:hypothetical protein
MFSSFDEVLTQSHKAIYSKIHIAVDRVLFPSDSTALGTTIDILEAGGSILLDDGKPFSYKTTPRMYGLMPRGRYVLFLRHIDPGDFYLFTTSIAIENGVALPTSPDAVAATKAGDWPFLSMKEADVVDRLSMLLKSQHQ